MTKGLHLTEEGEQGQSVAERRHTTGVSLEELLEGVEVRSRMPLREMTILQVTHDSRKVQPGALFVAIPGVTADGAQFAKDALAKGAVAVLSQAPAPADWPGDARWIQVAEARKALAVTAANLFGRPASVLKLVGVTGTNGKTTTTSLIDAILRAWGAKTGLFGTISYHTPSGEYPAPN